MLATPEEIRACLESPELIYDQNDYGPDRKMFLRGRLALPVNAAERHVLSVLHRTADVYDRGDVSYTLRQVAS
ncbi:hypothetical protein [Planomonospora alba]